MAFEVQDLDLILVPAGLFVMICYHIYFIYRLLKYPHTTVIGYENHNRKAWVHKMMQGGSYTSQALNVLSITTWGVIYMAIITLSLSTFIGTLVGSSTSFLSTNVFIIGSTSPNTILLKYICMLFSFILAFASFVQSARYFIQTDFYISTPIADIPEKYVQSSVIRGNNFWHLGLRLLYFAMAFLFWSFGPIPMFVSCLIMVVLLYFLDYNSKQFHPYNHLKKRVKDVYE